MFYAPKGKRNPVCRPGEFPFAAVGLDHGHIYGMCNGLLEAGAELKCVYDSDPEKVAQFRETYPEAAVCASYEDILSDPDVRLIACAAVPCERADIGLRTMRAGKDFFSDKAPLTTLEQLTECRAVAAETGRKFMAYFSERLHVECAVYAGQLIRDGAIGRVIHMDGFGPHRLAPATRPEWFFDGEKSGGILCDIGCHQIEQFLHFTGAQDAKIEYARTANYHTASHRRFEDFGELALTGDNGASAYIRVDWFTPDSLPVWGDGRVFLIGTEGTIELRKYINIATQETSDHLFLCTNHETRHIEAAGTVGFPFFGKLIRDCLDRTENAMPQEHVFRVMALALQAQRNARFDDFGSEA